MGMGLAAFATGLGGGYMAQQERNRRNKIEDTDVAFKNEQRDRQRVEWDDADKVKAGVKESDLAFTNTLKSFDGPQLSPAPDPGSDALGNPKPQMSLAPQSNPLQGIVAQNAQPGAAPNQSVAPAANPMASTGAVRTLGKSGKSSMIDSEAPDPRLLTAMQAKTNVLLQKGLLPQYKEAWLQTAELRSKVRANEFASADKEYALTGDPSVYAKRIYPLIEDGHDFVGSQNAQGKDGKPVMQIVRRNQQSGEESTTEIPVDRFLRSVEIARDPAAVLASEASYAKKRFETDQEIRKEEAKAKAVASENRSTEGVKLENSKVLENLKSGNNIKEIGVRMGGERSNTAERISLEQQAPRVLGEGQVLTVPQRNKDGSISYVAAAKGLGKQTPAVNDAQLSSMVINNFGDNDPVSGRKIGNANTAKIAAATRIIMKANPGLDANQAAEAAAREITKPAGAK